MLVGSLMFAQAYLIGQVHAIGQWLRRSCEMFGREGSIVTVAVTLKYVPRMSGICLCRPPHIFFDGGGYLYNLHFQLIDGCCC